jgi:hypothetical protein
MKHSENIDISTNKMYFYLLMSGSLAVILADKINAMANLLGLMRLTTDKTKKPIRIMYFGVVILKYYILIY